MVLSAAEQAVVDAFYQLYMTSHPNGAPIVRQTRWMNIPCFKLPQDLWIYQEIIVKNRPDLIIETGTFLGGSALYMAHVLDAIGRGRIISIDTQKLPRPEHPRIQYVHGSSTDEALASSLIDANIAESRMVILDSDHTHEHVLNEMSLWGEYVTLGQYMIVEDTHLEKDPTNPNFGPGPIKAVEDFLVYHPEFVVEKKIEKFLLSFNTGGYLRRENDSF
jgi:cephalosporin hydroxylase